jgi:hypothetical protein
MNKNIKYFLIGVAILIGLVITANYFGFFNEKPILPQSEPSRSEETGNNSNLLSGDCDTEKVIGIKISGEEVVDLYKTIARLEAQLAACEGGLQKDEAKPAATATAGRSAAPKPAPTPAPKPAPTPAPTPAPESSHTANPQIAVNQYVGEIIGDFGVTFDGDSKLFFYVKESLLKSVANRSLTDSYLNGKTGAKGQIIGDYVLYKTDQTVLSNMLNNEWKYAIYIGDHAQYSYDMWLPHELVKLNSSLSENQNIKPNSMGGYEFLSKINYKSK